MSSSGNVGAAEGVNQTFPDIIFENGPRIYQITELSGAAAEAVTGAYEERFNGGICQYFLRTSDPALIALALDDLGDEDFEELLDTLEDELEDLSFDARDLNRAFENAVFDFEESSEALRDYLDTTRSQNGEDFEEIREELEYQVRASRDQLEAVRELLQQNDRRIQSVERRLESQPQEDVQVVAVNNPCRRFEIGETILVVSVDQGSEFILQPTY